MQQPPQEICVSTEESPVVLAVQSFGRPPHCDRCRYWDGARWLDDLWLCARCYTQYLISPESEKWR